MDAWTQLLEKSTAVPGSDAWTHLLAQEGGGVGGFLDATITLDQEDPTGVTIDFGTLNILVEDEAISVLVAEDAISVSVSDEDVTVEVGTDDEDILVEYCIDGAGSGPGPGPGP